MDTEYGLLVVHMNGRIEQRMRQYGRVDIRDAQLGMFGQPDVAGWLCRLESDLKSVLEVSQAVGYDDLAFFRRLFRRYTGCSPRAYRDRFGVSAPATVAMAGRVPHR